MKPLDKILYLQNAVNLNDKEFCKRYKISLNKFKLWKLFKRNPREKDIRKLTEIFNLDTEDFMDNNSSLFDVPAEGEHKCKDRKIIIEDKDLIYEDFAREENGRYEEKD